MQSHVSQFPHLEGGHQQLDKVLLVRDELSEFLLQGLLDAHFLSADKAFQHDPAERMVSIRVESLER